MGKYVRKWSNGRKPFEHPDYSLVPETDWAYLAGIIEGEGSIHLDRTVRKSKCGFGLHLVLDVSNTDPRLMVWLKSKFGGYIRQARRLKPQHGINSRFQCFKWHVPAVSAYEILEHCYPYMVFKREQADIAFAFRNTTKTNLGRSGMTVEVSRLQESLWLQLKAEKSANKIELEPNSTEAVN